MLQNCYPMQSVCTILNAYRFIITLLWLLASPLLLAVEQESDLSVGVPSDVLADYFQMFGEQPDFTHEPNYFHPFSRRDVVEVALLQRALMLGDMDWHINLVPMEGYLRITQQIQVAKLALSGTTVFEADANKPSLYLAASQPIVTRGQFNVGIYTAPNNRRALASSSLDDLRKLRFVVAHNWQYDIKLLSELGVKNLIKATSWESMVKMVLANRADALLAPFSNREDLAIAVFDAYPLIPIPNMRVAFPVDRVYLLSTKHPHYSAVRAALTKGILQLIATGEANRAYLASGFFNPQTESWPVINP